MFVNSKDVVVMNEKPVRITRIVSVILNGVVLNKLAVQHGHDVNAMAEYLMLNLSGTVQRTIPSRDISYVNQSLRKEIDRRIHLSQTL